MTQIEIMDEIIKMLLDFLRKQAFAVVILVCGLGGIIWFAKDQKQEFSAQMADVRTELRACGNAREADAVTIRDLSVKLAMLQTRVDLIEPPRRANRR